MKMNDYAKKIRSAFISSVPAAQSTRSALPATGWRAKKHAETLKRMGKAWVMHPDYKPDDYPHHRPQIKRSVVLQPVIDAARAGGRLP